MLVGKSSYGVNLSCSNEDVGSVRHLDCAVRRSSSDRSFCDKIWRSIGSIVLSNTAMWKILRERLTSPGKVSYFALGGFLFSPSLKFT